MSLARAGVNRDTTLIIPHLTEEKVRELGEKLAQLDAETEVQQDTA